LNLKHVNVLKHYLSKVYSHLRLLIDHKRKIKISPLSLLIERRNIVSVEILKLDVKEDWLTLVMDYFLANFYRSSLNLRKF